MKFIIVPVCCIATLIIPLIFKYLPKKEGHDNIRENEIIWPRKILWIVLICFIAINTMFVLASAFELFTEMQWWESLLLWGIVGLPYNLACVWCIMLMINWKVIVYDDHVEYYNWIKKKKVYYFDEYIVKNYSASVRVVKQIKTKNGKKKYKCYVGVSPYCINFDILNKKYKEYKKSK
ncbi:MAG: hypothetical protein IJ458_01875 [Clostridia bacterium]|nr:hypothetical protein [Clostridia bacterium]MBQ8522394.1 hypothetical protein [Clostridia bacterium]